MIINLNNQKKIFSLGFSTFLLSFLLMYIVNIPRYVNTFEEEESIDLDKISYELQTLETEMKNIDKDILKYCEELGIKAPIV